MYHGYTTKNNWLPKPSLEDKCQKEGVEDSVQADLTPTMRMPKALNPRLQKQLLLRFGVYEKVLPMETTPSRSVPDHIEKPEYVLQKQPLVLLDKPEIKDVNQLRGMRRSCKLAANVLAHVKKNIYLQSGCVTMGTANMVGRGKWHNGLDMFRNTWSDIALNPEIWQTKEEAFEQQWDTTKPGITTDEIDEMVHKLTVEAGAYPSPLHYKGFPKSVCTSVNNVAVHGIPDLRPLQDGDIVNIDITVYFKGFHGDCSKTFTVGKVDDRGLQLVSVTEECLNHAITTCGPGVPFSEIGATIFKHSRKNGLTVLPAFIGHGIGQYFHGPPDIYHTINRYPGQMMPGMTFTIEPVLSHGSKHTLILEDGWTVITEDGSRSAQAEHTILVTDDGAEILTK